MDWLTFFSSIIKSVAWPVTLITVLVIVRKQLPSLVDSLRKLKFKGVELEFGERVKEMAAEASAVLPPVSKDHVMKAEASHFKIEGQGIVVNSSKFNIGGSARSEILEAWLLLEGEARRLVAKKTGAQSDSELHGERLGKQLLNLGLIDQREAVIFDELRELRNQAVHLPSASFLHETVNSYIDSALTLMVRFENIGRELGDADASAD